MEQGTFATALCRGCRGVLCVAMAFVLSGCMPGASARRVQPVATIALTVDHTGLPSFDATVNGQGVHLFLDTGGYKPLALKQDVIHRIGIAYDAASASASDAQGHAYVARSFDLHDFKAGSLSLAPLRGADLPDLGTHAYPQDGYLGYGVLKNYVLVIDYAGGKVSLYTPADGRAVLEQQCGEHTFDVTVKNAIIQTTIATDRGDRTFQFDTGANRNIVRPVSGAAAEQASVTFERFRLGSVDLGATPFGVIPYRAPDVDGVLGRDFFAAHRVCLDLGAGKGAFR